jgi:hypothetical protein
MNTRTALGTCLVLTAILAGAVFLDRAQRLVPVYAAARDLPAGATLHHGDLVVVRVRLPTTALRHYLQPTPGRTVAGRVLAAPVRHETLVPAELLLASSHDADLVELPYRVPVARLPFVGAVAAPSVTVGATQHSRVDRFRGLVG